MATRYQVMMPGPRKQDQELSQVMTVGGAVAGGVGSGSLSGASAGANVGSGLGGLMGAKTSGEGVASGGNILSGAADYKKAKANAAADNASAPASDTAETPPAPIEAPNYNAVQSAYDKQKQAYESSPTAQLLASKEALKTASPEVRAQAEAPIDAALKADAERRRNRGATASY